MKEIFLIGGYDKTKCNHNIMFIEVIIMNKFKLLKGIMMIQYGIY